MRIVSANSQNRVDCALILCKTAVTDTISSFIAPNTTAISKLAKECDVRFDL